MKLAELIQFFRNGGSYEEFCQTQSLDTKSEVVEIYMEQPLKIDNNLAFFEIEKTEGNIEYSYNGIKYSNLFDFYYFLDAIEESNNDDNQALSNEELTKLLYNYAINDA
ncbi:hypothetical protein SAMN05421594_4735 [Chryseobacterium oleae]|uniref:Uncharacterized protein n=1 Tax=Chryseobacterium oleae TaxID=491207 RepID=A0A1I5CZN8_CHROL|nr:hypothetical protein [Chryseobacterium oleae]SFN92434.1 hypothetical protein SAMN05421594_4735 [Chryseobacterium oleae]